MKNVILPVDKVRIYGKCRLDYLTKPHLDREGNTVPAPFKRVKRGRQDGNTIELKMVVPATGYVITASYQRERSRLIMDFCPARLVYPDNNQLLTLEQAQEAIKMLISLTGLPLRTFKLTRLDITHDIEFNPSNFNRLKPHLQAPKGCKKKSHKKEKGKEPDFSDSDNFNFQSQPAAKTGQTKKYLLVYAKGGKTRIEMRLFSAPKIRSELGESENLTLEHVLTPAFVERANEYYASFIEQMTGKGAKRKPPKHKLVIGFKNRALAVLPEAALC